MIKFSPPYFGAAYYPEAWKQKELDKDIKRMKDLGVNMVRVAEFAWAFMEPEEGKYSFEWLHRAVKALGEAGIAVVMCTPTATPPAWLTKKYPQSLAAMPTGQKFVHGARRHYCPNSLVYREFSNKINTRLAREFCKYPQIVAWQLDNEFSCHINSCYCEVCERTFRQFLKRIYGTIDRLNESWGTGLWSIRFGSFDEIPLPKPAPANHHPSLIYYFKYFMSHSYSNYAREQTRILRRFTAVPITTNGMPPFHELDYEDLFSNLDFASNDLYYSPEEMWKWCPELDWMRPLKEKPYWIMETSATSAGGLIPAAPYYHTPGALRAKCWLAFAEGGEAVSFWLWRAHWSGQEMEHGSLVYAWGEPTLAEPQIRQVSGELAKTKDFLNSTKPEKPRVAVHFSYPSMWIFNQGHLAWNFNYVSSWQELYYRPLLEAGIPRDVIYPNADVAGYSAVISPFMAVIPRKTARKMEDFMKNGGIWIVGPMSSFRNEQATAFQESAYGPLEKLIGAHVRHRFQASGKGKVDLTGHKSVGCSLWCDAFIPEKGTKAIAAYADGPAKGMAAAVERKIGRGKIVALGTHFDRRFLAGWLVSEIAKYAQAKAVSGCGIVAVRRVSVTGKPEGMIVVDIAGKGGKATPDKNGVDLLTGKKVKNSLSLPPYGVAVIKY